MSLDFNKIELIKLQETQHLYMLLETSSLPRFQLGTACIKVEELIPDDATVCTLNPGRITTRSRR